MLATSLCISISCPMLSVSLVGFAGNCQLRGRRYKRAALQDLNFHDLRHTFATRVRLHADAYTVRALLGHSKVDKSKI